MASKLKDMTALYGHMLTEVTASPGEWQGFLFSAGRNFKLRFDEQLMIHAQRPDATAVLEFERWNEVYERWINKGAKGIATIDHANPLKPRLKYYFDISDTHESRRSRPVAIWAMKPEYEDEVIEALAAKYGDEISDAVGMEQAATMAAQFATEYNLETYAEHLSENLGGSALEGMDGHEISDGFFNLVRTSVAYMTLARCGYEPGRYIPAPNFDFLRLFDTQQTAEILGIATSDIAEDVLREVASTVRAAMRSEKTANRTFAEPEASDNNGGVEQSAEEFERGYAERSDDDERDEPDVHPDAGRHDASGSDAAGAAGAEPRPLREDAAGLPSGTQEADVPLADEPLPDGGAPSGDRADGKGARHDDDGAGREADGRGREDEAGRPDEVGRPDEQHQGDGGAGGGQGTDPRVELPPPRGARISQINLFEEPTEQTPVGSSLPEEDALIGRELEIDGRRYRIEDVGRISGDVHLTDVTFEGEAGIPIGRVIKIGHALRLLGELSPEKQSGYHDWSEPATEDNAPEVLGVPSDDASAYLPKQEKRNFRITDDALGHGGQKAKYRANIEALKTLNIIEHEGRLATPAEQETLSRYVGWGSLPQVFDEENAEWHVEHLELKEYLAPEDYASARATTLNAHYTSPTVIKAIYKAVQSMGFKGGNILEPSCGIGNFMGLLPESMGGSKVYGVELDRATASIAGQLYQESMILRMGFEEADFPDNFFDLAVGNVPFGGYGVADRRYDKHGFLIHDYFFAKTLDKVRPGGVVAFVTSKGTLDKQNNAVRKYIAQRAELLGAIRLPNNAFMQNAGTAVTADILFLQKRDRVAEAEPDWIHLGLTEDGVPVNSYFLENPDMMLGEMTFDDSMYGNEKDTTCKPISGADLAEQLEEAVSSIHAEIAEYETSDGADIEADESIPADPSVRNFSFTLVGGKIYFRENSRMHPAELTLTARERVRGMVEIRDCLRTLIDYQSEGWPDEDIEREQRKLNRLYDAYVARHGILSSRGNQMAFGDDSSYALLCALEDIDDDGNYVGKAAMFTQRTIRPVRQIDHVDTPAEALAVSISEKAGVDVEYMSGLCGKTPDEIYGELRGVVFYDTLGSEAVFRTADDFLSGNVRQKLKDWEARLREHEQQMEALGDSGDTHGVPGLLDNARFNVEALKAVQPEDLTASEIDVRLGATWLPPDVAEQFMFELLDTPRYARQMIAVHYSEITAGWNVEGKNRDPGNVKANGTYGTRRVNAYKIIEETLNLKDVRVFDYVEDEEGRRVAVLNKKETTVAQQKQEAVKAAFSEWVWNDPGRRQRLTEIYNERFNSIRPREYDGSNIVFPGMNPEIRLYDHQKNAVAHILYGGNTLLAHVVGAGKTFEMTAAAMEGKRLGLCSKSLFVVPNHLTEQWASEFLQLYPAANVLVSKKKDFETKNRRKFCSRIATGEYDAVIIGHSQFEKIPLSAERQRMELQKQIDDLTEGVAELKAERGERYSIKQLEKMKKSLEVRLKKLNDQSRKDDVVTFEELGVDRLFVDEAHYYKNLVAFTKMRNVGGIAQTEAMKSSDLFMKCRYLDEATGYRGTVFATGTPISNSMVEMYTMQRYLQHGELERHHITHFDAWASTFGETVTAVELAPEGTGYRAKTRFARFYNLPELMSMFRQVADIKTSDMLDLPVPEAEYHNVVVKPSEAQKELVASLSERADKVRNKMVSPNVDNMLVITNDGRKIALDERLVNPMLPGRGDGKASVCADNVYRIWQDGAEGRLTQLVFCDLSTPKSDGSFNVYDDIKAKLIAKGVPEEQIAFIHSANTEAQKKEMFAKVRSGQIRVLMGSTQKMGAGTNVQDRLIAIHDLDCPWRPSDLEQRSGRIIRQGNGNAEVDIYRYVTEGTFDSYLYQLVENKQKFIGQIMTSKSPVRSAEDVDEQALSYAEIKALATGNPHIKEKMDLDLKVARLKVVKSSYLDQRYALEDRIVKGFPEQMKKQEEVIAGLEADIVRLDVSKPPNEDTPCPMTVGGTAYAEPKKAGEALIEALSGNVSVAPVKVGEYRGFELRAYFDAIDKEYVCQIVGDLRHKVSLGADARGNITRIDNALAALPGKLAEAQERLENTRQQLENAKEEVKKPFPQEDELKQMETRLRELNVMLNMDEKDHDASDADFEPDEETDAPERDADIQER